MHFAHLKAWWSKAKRNCALDPLSSIPSSMWQMQTWWNPFSTISWLARPFSLAVFCIADLNQQRVPDDQCRENKIIVLATPSLGSLTWLKVAAVSGFGSNDSRGVAHKRPKLCCPYSLVRTGRVKLSSEHTWLNSPVTFTWKHLTVLIHQTL